MSRSSVRTRAPAGADRMEPSGRLVLFDLDRTLLPGSSLAHLGRELAARRIVARRQLAGHLARNAVFARRGAGDHQVDRIRTALLAAAAGSDHALLAAVACEVGENLGAVTFSGARWLMARHLDGGDFCVVVSASPQELVEAVARSMGAHRAVGTVLDVEDGRCTGRLGGRFCYGAGKVERLREELGDVHLEDAVAYSDSISDLPLLASCGTAVAVNPDRRLRTEAVRRGWPVLRFA